MANLTENSQWETGVTAIATTDQVLGGDTGPLNAPSKKLANRTLYLKTQLDVDDHKTISLVGDSGATRETITATAAATNKGAVKGTANGTGTGVAGTGGATGIGVTGTGGATSGSGGEFTGTAGNAVGAKGTGQGSGAGLQGNGGTTGNGVEGNGGSTSGAGVVGTGGAGTPAFGVKGVGGGSGTLGSTSDPSATNKSGVFGIGKGTGVGVVGTGGGDGGHGAWFKSGGSTSSGVVAESSGSGAGCNATNSSNGQAVSGTNTGSGSGVQGYANNAGSLGVNAGVVGLSSGLGSGVLADCSAGTGFALQLAPDTTSPVRAAVRWPGQDTQPTGAHQVGDLYMTTAGDLVVCTVAGTPGTWKRVGRLGTTTNDNAVAGDIGETLSVTRVRSAATALTSGTALNVTSTGKITLTPGDWWVRGGVGFTAGGAVVLGSIAAAVSKTAAPTMPATDTRLVPTSGEFTVRRDLPSSYTLGTGFDESLIIPPYRVSVASNTDLYLLGLASWTTSTLSVFGYLEAGRAR